MMRGNAHGNMGLGMQQQAMMGQARQMQVNQMNINRGIGHNNMMQMQMGNNNMMQMQRGSNMNNRNKGNMGGNMNFF